ncbi:ATPase, AAA family domain-containing protein [Theileria equi strain WA]|uniref:ATPase, AAA family domain-containing protein n=1 Tax=Theileria equi strain WA TaxID=1537102 RepID=L0B1Q0_THEEQ|nr:ATPase, AAA family domain-containing protein [Theileria equi strain WA]AFZ81398.1 ATPase, AAA family domain-containing protein [Theileria equi strain WA]|eukprot:XP_004831064.1 ATPase, AAA family domain-containing protein [Theileria equi strain WA]
MAQNPTIFSGVLKSNVPVYGTISTIRSLDRRFTHSSTRIYRLRRTIEDGIQNKRLSELNLREANAYDPRLVIRAVESCYSNTIPKDEGILKEYLKALVFTNSLDSRSLKSLVDTNSDTLSGEIFNDNRGNFPENKEMYLKTDDKNPIHVVVNSPNGNTNGFLKFSRRLLSIGTIALCFGTFYLMLNQNLQRGIKYSFKIVSPEDLDTTFDDVKVRNSYISTLIIQGCDEVREELDEIIEYLRNPKKFEKLGAKLPKGILLAGSPGTGKTLLARAVAGEAGVPFIHSSGSEFEEMFVGVGARRIRELFKTARSISPCIVFIDELDAVGSKRSSTDHSSVRMTLNQLLVELDGFAKYDGVVVLCATNFPESLDPALIRPGRLDKTIHIPLPDYTGRYEILKLYSKKILLSPEVDLKTIAKRTVGMTGADIFNILNMAALKCSIQGLASVTTSAIEEAFDRVVVGLKGKPLVNDRERTATAYHEGGHTLVSLHTQGTTKVHKATILPRGRTLGVTWKIPEEKYDTRMVELKSELDVLMGGMAAEEAIYGKENITTGCQSDLERATEIARTMVMKFGVGLKNVSGPMYIDTKRYPELSEELRKKIDSAVQTLLDEAYERASSVIRNNIGQLHNLSKALVRYETLTLEEINKAVDGNIEEIAVQRKLIQESKNTSSRLKDTINVAGDFLPEPQHSFKSHKM